MMTEQSYKRPLFIARSLRIPGWPTLKGENARAASSCFRHAFIYNSLQPASSYFVFILSVAGNLVPIKIPPHPTGIFVPIGLAPAPR